MNANEPKLQMAIRLTMFTVTELHFKSDINVKIEPSGKFKLDVGFHISYIEDRDKIFLVNFNFELNYLKEEEDSGRLWLVAKASGIFETAEPIDAEFKASDFVNQNAPAIAFPYLRSFITTLTANTGIGPIILPSFNFAKD